MIIRRKKAFQILLIVSILVFMLVACKGIDNQEKNIQEAEETIDSVLKEEDFEALEETEKIQKVEEMLEQLTEDGAIEKETIEYDDVEQLFTFEYSDGTLGGISLRDFSDEFNENGPSGNGQEKNIVEENTSTSKALDALVLNGFENKSSRREFYEELEKEWEAQGVNTTVDTDVTIEDLKGLSGYEIVVFAMHGSVYNSEPVLNLNQEVTRETDKQYEAELDNKWVAKVYCSDYKYHYWIFDDLFTSLYTEINNSLIFSETCMFYGCDCIGTIDTTFADSLSQLSAGTIIGYHNSVEMHYSRNVMKETIDNLLQGDVVKEALQKAIDIYGENDGYEDESRDKYKAYPIITGNQNIRLVELAASDFTIPTDLVITLGELSVIEPEIEPKNASGYQIKWSSSDEKVATVTTTGEKCVITTHTKGTTTIKATMTSGENTIVKTTDIRVASKGRDTVLVLDISGSMRGTPITEMKEAAVDFCQELLLDEYNNRVGIVFYDDEIITIPLTDDLNSLVSYIEQVDDGGMTNMEAGIATAKDMLEQQGKADSIKNIVIMADGLPNDGKTSNSGSMTTTTSAPDRQIAYASAVIDTAKEAMNLYNMYSLGFFHGLSEDELTFAVEFMKELTNQADGYHQVEEAEKLQFAFGDISEEISDGSKIVINIACPVDVAVTYKGETLSSAVSSYNDKTSFGTLQLLGTNQDIKVLSLEPDIDYDIQLTGTGDGVMNYSVNYMNENEEVTDCREFRSVPITPTTKITSRTNVKTEDMALNIDEDGDGEVDTIWTAAKDAIGSITYEKNPKSEEEQEVIEAEPQQESEQENEKENFDVEAWKIALIVIGVLSFAGIAVATVLICMSKQSKMEEDIPEVECESDEKEWDVLPREEQPTEDKEPVFAPAISIVNGPLAGAEIPIRDKEIIYIGKDSQRANVVFSGDYPNVSRLHCSVMYDAKYQKYFVTDSSSNGTYYSNNIRLEKGKRTAVSPGTVLILANDNAKIMLR